MTGILTSNRGSLRAMVRQSTFMTGETLQIVSPFISACANQRISLSESALPLRLHQGKGDLSASMMERPHLSLFSFTSFQARRHVQSSLWSSIGMSILALQYLQYLRFSLVPFKRILWSNSRTVDSWGSSGKGSCGSDSFVFLRMGALAVLLDSGWPTQWVEVDHQH
jgi:hypothetical protein